MPADTHQPSIVAGMVRLALAMGLIVAGMCMATLLGEIWVRTARWPPAAQVVRGNCLHVEEGIPVWGCESHPDDVRRKNRDCTAEYPERMRVLFLGSSITYGTSLSAAEVFTVGLEDRLNAERPQPGFCVLNFAERAFQFDQKYAVGRREVDRYRPALILWESWSELRTFKLIGAAAYAISDYRLGPDGFVGIDGVPAWLNRPLFLHSRLYEHLALRLGARSDSRLGERAAMIHFYRDKLSRVIELARRYQTTLVVYRSPPLDHPFAEVAGSPSPSDAVLAELLGADGVPYYSLAQELAGQDHLRLRLDPCCHFNAAGHRALQSVMERIVFENLGG